MAITFQSDKSNIGKDNLVWNILTQVIKIVKRIS